MAIQVKNGSKEAIEELLKIFNPLLCKISNKIYIRYKRLFPLDEIIRQSRCLLIQLTVLNYQPGGIAHYPHFLKQFIHAGLVAIYRQDYIYANKVLPLENIYLPIPVPFNDLYQNERIEICIQLMAYIDKTFNEREKNIINLILYNNIPRNEVARRYHISFTRMKVIYKRIIKKLKEYLIKTGIKDAQDI